MKLKIRALCFQAKITNVLQVTGLQGLRLSKSVIASPACAVTCHVSVPFQFSPGGFHAPNQGPGFGGAAYKHFSDSDPGHTLYISENNVTGGFLSPSSLTRPVQGCPPSTSPQNTHGPVEKQQLWENTHGGVQHTLLSHWDRSLWPSAW